MNKKFILLSLIVILSLSACILPEKEDPFAKIPDEKVETIYGEVFPFSVSVSTRATHRIENDNKLVSLIASDIVQLDEFEGRIVEVDGVYRKEKMRPIFWVESIRVKDLGQNPAKLSNRFESTNYSFVTPENWENSILDNGTVHFLDKLDTNRKVFLTFSVKDLEDSDKKTDPNIVMANMAGYKESSSFDSGQVRQEITLFSNLFEDKKYVFVFNNNSSDFSRKKEFFKLLNSFIEGEENVISAHKEELKKLAEIETRLVKKDNEKAAELEPENNEDSDNESIISRILGSDDDKSIETIDVIAKEEVLKENVKLSNEFENKIDGRAFNYESQHYGVSMKVPYGLWFKNFGPTDKYITQIGFATHELSNKSGSEFFLNIIKSEEPVTDLQENIFNGNIYIKFPRNNKSHYEIIGSAHHRDYMRSLQATINSW